MKSIVTTPRVLARIPSHSNPAKSYEIRLGADGVVYCTCRGWVTKKYCKHLEEYHGQGSSPLTAEENDSIMIKFFKEQSKPLPVGAKGSFDEIIQNGIINGRWK